jgi:hypothetical protein
MLMDAIIPPTDETESDKGVRPRCCNKMQLADSEVGHYAMMSFNSE